MDPIRQPLQITVPPATAQAKPAGNFWQEDGPSFKDMLDTINPLQHIPVVSTLYQSLTGDKPSTGAQIAGGALFGGALGLFGSVINSIVESQTGADIGGNIMAAITGTPTPGPQTVAAAEEPASEPAHFISASQRSAYNAYISVQSA